MLIIGGSGILRNIFTGFQSLFNTQRLVQEGYAQSQGEAFAIPHRDRFLLLVSSPKHMEELAVESTRKHSKLSSQGIMADVNDLFLFLIFWGFRITFQLCN